MAKKCSKAGINIGSLLSPPNLLWDLQGFDTIRQLLVGIFHNLHEGHCNELYHIFSLFTAEAKRLTRANWDDRALWSPNTGESSTFMDR